MQLLRDLELDRQLLPAWKDSIAVFGQLERICQSFDLAPCILDSAAPRAEPLPGIVTVFLDPVSIPWRFAIAYTPSDLFDSRLGFLIQIAPREVGPMRRAVHKRLDQLSADLRQFAKRTRITADHTLLLGRPFAPPQTAIAHRQSGTGKGHQIVRVDRLKQDLLRSAFDQANIKRVFDLVQRVRPIPQLFANSVEVFQLVVVVHRPLHTQSYQGFSFGEALNALTILRARAVNA
ncbi:MAG: hypothetical protein QNJ16_11765 [Rhodobacter sp.]|nr:hypothetical protein [Rhodobacter sp.]